MGVGIRPVCPALPLWWFLAPRVLRLGGQGAVVPGGPQVLVNSWVQACSQGQCWGRCRRILRAERAIRAGTVISSARIVAVVALAWKVEARAPAARVERDRGQMEPW